jgi:AraC-like DNA-binding protein
MTMEDSIDGTGVLEAFSGRLGSMMLPVDRLFDGVADVVFFVKDVHGRYVMANDTLAVRCGLADRREVVGRRASGLFPAPLGKAFADQDRRVLEQGVEIRDHLEMHLYPGGRRGWCLTYKQPVRGADGRIIGLCGISRDLNLPDKGDDQLEGISAAIAHIRSHFDEGLRLPELAAIAGMSVYQFDRRIRALFRLSAGQFLVKTRIDAACHMLAQSDKPVVHVAMDCGYSDQSAFSRQFKQTTGMSPLAYRRSHRGGSTPGG